MGFLKGSSIKYVTLQREEVLESVTICDMGIGEGREDYATSHIFL